VTYREAALRKAITQIGVTENPPGSNSGTMVDKYLAQAGLNPGYPWCMAFVNWCYAQVGLDIEHPNEASVGFFESWAKQNGMLVAVPQRGDIICYRYDGDDWPDHVGIIESHSGSVLNTVEGNTGIGHDANGGKVMRRERTFHRVKFARIPGFVPTLEEDMPTWFPAWWKWRLLDGSAATRPESAPATIPQKYLDLVKVAEKYGAARVADSDSEVARLKTKISAAKSALA
jgi:hypothetical protein